MSEFPTDVVDERGNVHLLAEPIGHGGQGVVFRTRDPNTAVKLVTTGPTAEAQSQANPDRSRLQEGLTRGFGGRPLTGSSARERLRQRLETVHTLPVPADLNLATPLALLRDYAGYSMQLLQGMEPIQALFAPPGCEDASGFYRDNGGLRRRLEILARTAEILARLHSQPLVYADISPNNVFIPRDRDDDEVWLIDLDNLHFQTRRGPGVHTPGFGAPELAQGTAGASTLTDCWAFAVLTWYVLTQTHPFLGDHVESGGWEDDEDLEQKALAGHLPWIHDEKDDVNYSENGIFPRDLVLSPRLFALFHETFGPGRTDPLRRPGMLLWSEALRRAVDLTVTCRGCGHTFYVPARRCPWCADSPAAECLYLQSRLWVPDDGTDEEGLSLRAPAVWHKVVDANHREILGAQVVRAVSFRDATRPALEIRTSRRGIDIRPLDDTPYLLTQPDEEPTRLVDSKRLPLPVPGQECHLHCGPLGEPHRIVSFLYIHGTDA